MNADEALQVLRELDEPEPDSVPGDTLDQRIADAVQRGSRDPAAASVTVTERPQRTRRVRRVLVGIVTAVVVGTLAVTAVVVTVFHHASTPTQTPATTSTALTAAARALLSRWDAAHSGVAPPELIVTSELATQDGDWTGADAGAEKVAFIDGRIDIGPGVIESGTPPATIRWDDGATAAAAPLSPQAALDQAVPHTKEDSGPSVPPLVVTSVTGSSGSVSTTRGRATVPTWVLDLQNTKVRLVVVAATAYAPNPLATDMPSRNNPQVARDTVPVNSVTVSPDGRTLTASFTGATHDATSPCGEDYTADVVADTTAVVVIVQRHPYAEKHTGAYATGPDVLCRLPGATRQASAHLDTPWAGRPALDIYTGQPVPAT